jgi:hypothetical protein
MIRVLSQLRSIQWLESTIAAQGDADAGLRGISKVTPPRQPVTPDLEDKQLPQREPLRYQNHYEA